MLPKINLLRICNLTISFLKVIFFVFITFHYLSLQATDIDINKIKKNVHIFTLSNGLRFLFYEDHSFPVLNILTYVNVGGSDETDGFYGISHFIEHLATKGTNEIGTINSTPTYN